MMVGPHSPWPLRCLRTNKPCGTETVRLGALGCACQNCRLWLASRQPAKKAR